MKTMQAKFRARMVAVLTVAAVALGFLQLAPAGADDTTVTFAVTSGTLTIDNAETSVNLGNTTHTLVGSTVSASLGNIVVSDLRNLSVGWVASGATTDFTHTDTVNKVLKAQASIVQTNTLVSNTGVTSFVGGTATGIGGVLGTAVAVGSNTATFAPTMTVIAPAGTPTGTYTGTFTSTVV